MNKPKYFDVKNKGKIIKYTHAGTTTGELVLRG